MRNSYTRLDYSRRLVFFLLYMFLMCLLVYPCFSYWVSYVIVRLLFCSLCSHVCYFVGYARVSLVILLVSLFVIFAWLRFIILITTYPSHYQEVAEEASRIKPKARRKFLRDSNKRAFCAKSAKRFFQDIGKFRRPTCLCKTAQFLTTAFNFSATDKIFEKWRLGFYRWSSGCRV